MATAPKWLEGLGTNHPGEPAPAFLGWLPFRALIAQVQLLASHCDNAISMYRDRDVVTDNGYGEKNY